MSRIAFEMRDQMDTMSEEQFEDAMGLSKSAFLKYLDDASADEVRCAASVRPSFRHTRCLLTGGFPKTCSHWRISEALLPL